MDPLADAERSLAWVDESAMMSPVPSGGSRPLGGIGATLEELFRLDSIRRLSSTNPALVAGLDDPTRGQATGTSASPGAGGTNPVPSSFLGLSQSQAVALGVGLVVLLLVSRGK